MDSRDYEPVLRDEWVQEFLAECSLTKGIASAAGTQREKILQAKTTLLRVRQTLDEEIARLDRLLLQAGS